MALNPQQRWNNRPRGRSLSSSLTPLTEESKWKEILLRTEVRLIHNVDRRSAVVCLVNFCSQGEKSDTFFPRDRECIWGLITFECLSQFYQDENYENFAPRNLFLEESSPVETPEGTGLTSETIQQIPFNFHLTHLLPRCQRGEILLSTLVQDFYGFLLNPSSTNKELDRANHILYSLILDHLNQLHNGKQFHLSAYDNWNLPEVLSQRPREAQYGTCPLTNANIGNRSEVPKWRSFVKYISPKHFIITLLPSSFRDLKLLLANRANIIEGQTNAIQLVDKPEDLTIVEILEKMDESCLPPSVSEHAALGTAKIVSPSSQHQHSFTSTSSNISSCRSSSIPQDPSDRSPSQRLLFSANEGPKPTDEDYKRTRYRSGPPLSTHLPCAPVESLELLESPGPRRGRAFSLHSNLENGPPKRPSRQSLNAHTKEEKSSNLVSRERTDTWSTSGCEKYRKRNISMPSKCHKEMAPKAIHNKSLSAEAMKENEPQASIFQETDNIHSSTADSAQQPTASHIALYSSATLPVYCFDCRLSSFVNQFINQDSKELEVGNDIYIDSTFKADNYKVDDPSSLSEVKHRETGLNGTSHEAADKYPSPEPLSEESDTLAADSKSLKTFMESIEKCQRKSFVMGVFEALSNDLFVHSIDVQAALDQCQEVFLETDITNYLEIICGHLKDYRMKVYMKQKKQIDTLFSLGPEKLVSLQSESNKKILPIVQPFPLSLLNEHQACQDLMTIHYGINQKFSTILQSHFKPVANLPNFYYYFPKSTSYSQVENNKYKYWSLKRKAKKKSEEDDFTRLEHMNGVMNEEDEEEREKSIEFRSEDGSYVGPQRLLSQFSQFSQISEISTYEDGRISEEDDSENGNHPPLFLHLTCTIRRQQHTIGTLSITTLPTCLGDLAECFNVPEIDLSEVSVTLDVLVMTLLGGADIISEDVHTEQRGRRTISGCSTASSMLRLSESTTNSNPESEEMFVDDLLNHLPDDQHKAVLITFEKIKWLIQDEIVSSLLSCYPVTEEMLQLVASHVSDSNPAPNCHLETVSLKFVFGIEKSLEKFMQEFKNLKIDGYHLRKIGNLYFLAVLPDSCKKRRLFSLVPPLMLKGNPLDFNVKIAKETSRQVKEPSEESVTEALAMLEEAEGLLKKNQKVSFEANSSNETKGKTEESSSEVKKGEKWIRRRERKERRDSEKRGMLESSDSDEETSPTLFVARDSFSHNESMIPLETTEQKDEASVCQTVEVKEEAPKVSHEITENGGQKSSVSENLKVINLTPTKTAQRIESTAENVTSAQGTMVITESKSQMYVQNVRSVEMLSPKPVELIRCGSVNLPHTQGSKMEVIRKSASTDDFSPVSQDPGETPKGTPASGQSSTEGSKYHSDYSKSRHSSGGDILKSRHDSGTGSILGLYSDVSSLHGSEQTTEDGCEGDISDSDECTDWMQDFDVAQPQPPEFWVVIRIAKDAVQTYFHCRLEGEVERWNSVHKEVVRSLREQVKLVNQRLLLQNLNECRICDHLLEPETSEDVWKVEDAKDANDENNEYLEAAMKFKLGAFACPQVWSKKFELHPRLKLSGKGSNKGIQTLKKTLNPFMVNNRKNMFVYEDRSGIRTNVFYLRLNEEQSVSVTGTHVENRKDDSLSRSSSISSLAKRCIREDELTSQGEPRRSFIEKDVIVEGIPSTSAQRKSQDFIVLSVHGIADPGVDITEKLVQMLQKKLDDAVLDAICLMLWDNPHHKLTAEDVHFIQPPYQPPNRILRFSVNSFAVPYIPATCYYLRQNLLSCGFTPPKYTDSRPEHHFQDFSATDQDPTTEANIFLFVCSQKSGTKGVACLAFSVVDTDGNVLQPKGCPKVNAKGYEDLVSENVFESMTQTVQQSSENETDAVAMFQFKIWEAGRLDFEEIGKCLEGLEEAVRHALWDLTMECRFLMAPITPSCVTPTSSSQPTTPIKGSRPFGSPRNSVPMYERSGSPLSYSQESVHDDLDHSNASDPSPENLHNVFAQLMPKWLELGVQMNVPAVKKHVVVCPTRSALPIFMTEVQRWLYFHLPESTTKFFKRNADSSYSKIDVFKVSQLLKLKKDGEVTSYDFIITNRNEKQWWTILFEKSILDLNSHVIKANKNMKFGSQFVPHVTSHDNVSESIGNGSYLSSPTSLQALTLSDYTPQPQSQFKFGEFSGSPGFIHRQMFFLATLIDNELTVYSYNWMKDLNEMLHNYLNRLCHWTKARSSLLSSLALQKMGLFHNQPFFRKEKDSSKDEAHKKDSEKREEANPFVQNLHYIEGLIKSSSPGRDAMAPTERSARRNQPQPSLQNLSEVLRDSAPPKQLHKQLSKKDLLLRHGMQMAEVTRTKGKEKRFLQSLMQNQAATTPVDVALFKKHARVAHFCFTPLLFFPRWRSEVAAVRDHSFPDFTSGPEFSNQNKGNESRSRHESGASAKITGGGSGQAHLELRRSSSVGLPASLVAVPSPSHNRKRHAPLGGEDKWHDALCLSYQKEFIQYLHCLNFETLWVPHIQQNYNAKGTRGGTGNSKQEGNRETKSPDQDINLPTYLVRHCFGGTVLLQINFTEPYFGAIVYVLEASRTQYRKLRNKCQSNSFIDEVELIRLHLHMHSFTYDYHLRAVCVYVANRQPLFAIGYHLSSFLSDFIKYYNKSPSCARNLIHTGEVRIEDTGTPGEQLYNYLLAREKEYQMQVLRMIPITCDMTSDRYTEFVLVHTKAYRFPFDECEQRDGDDYDVTLLVSHDTNGTPSGVDNNNTLNLKFYVILACRRNMYPNRDPENKSGKFRTVSTANTIDQLKNNANHESNDLVTVGTPTYFPITASSSTSSLSSVNSVTNTTKAQGIPNSKTHLLASKGSSKTSHMSIRDESINYLSYYSEYQIYMQQILQEQVAEARERILKIFGTAKIHCRRDTLWQKLMWGFKEEEKLKSVRDQSSHILNFAEFTELLNLVSVNSISTLDPQLVALVSKPISWYHSLTRLLSVKYQDSSRYGIRVLLSPDEKIQYVVVFSLTCPDACIIIFQNFQTQRADIRCLRKHSEGDILDPKTRNFLQDFINCCCYHLWSGLI